MSKSTRSIIIPHQSDHIPLLITNNQNNNLLKRLKEKSKYCSPSLELMPLSPPNVNSQLVIYSSRQFHISDETFRAYKNNEQIKAITIMNLCVTLVPTD